MSAARVTEIRTPRTERLPSVASEKIMRFLNAGHTGTVQLDIKDGKIITLKITESLGMNALYVDSDIKSAQD